MAQSQKERSLRYDELRRLEGLAKVLVWIPNNKESRKKLRASAARLRKAAGILLTSEK